MVFTRRIAYPALRHVCFKNRVDMSTDFYQQDRRGRWRRSSTMTADRAPRKRSTIIIGGVIGFLVLAIGIFAGFRIINAGTDAAFGATQNYCAQITHQNYSAAYAQLVPALQAQISQPAYVAAMQALDHQRGNATSCRATNTKQAGSLIHVGATINRMKTGKETNTLTFAQSNSSWKLSQAPDVAIMPLASVYAFCLQLQHAKFGDAYTMLTSHFQQASGPLTTFVNDSTSSVQITGAIDGCHLQQIGMSSDGHTATIHFGIDFAHFINLPSQIVTVQRDTSAWKIDQMQFTAAGVSLPFPLPLTTIQNAIGILKQICSLAPPNALCTVVNLLP